jgi:signal transduction histidine kinase
MSWFNWFTSSLTRQFMFLLLLALIAGQTIPFAISWNERKIAVREAVQSEFITRASSLSQLAQHTTPAFRREMLSASATSFTRFWISTDSPMDTEAWAKDGFAQIRRPLFKTPESTGYGAMYSHPDMSHLLDDSDLTQFRWQPLHSELWEAQEKAQFFMFADNDGMAMTTQLTDGVWLNAINFKPLKAGIWRPEAILWTTVTAVFLCLIGAVIARLIARPLKQLAKSAEALGRGEIIPILAEKGPAEVRQLSEAFNLMQQRLTRFVDDRTRMLAAIGHDLRTPLTTLRLRAEFMPDGEARTKLIRTVDEMEEMTTATLNFAKSEATSEETRVIDLNALIDSLCDDLAEIGNDVTFEESPKTAYRCRPDGLKRAIRNLIENALRYGGKAMVHLKRTHSNIEIIIEDPGPGIPEDQMEKVFSPFYRLDASRNSETGGVGLGLSIARTIIHQHGGEIILAANNPGLRATVALPNG